MVVLVVVLLLIFLLWVLLVLLALVALLALVVLELADGPRNFRMNDDGEANVDIGNHDDYIPNLNPDLDVDVPDDDDHNPIPNGKRKNMFIVHLATVSLMIKQFQLVHHNSHRLADQVT